MLSIDVVSLVALSLDLPSAFPRLSLDPPSTFPRPSLGVVNRCCVTRGSITHRDYGTPPPQAAARSFPGQQNLSTWQGKTAGGGGPVTCTNAPQGTAADLTLSATDCAANTWVHNATDLKLRWNSHNYHSNNHDTNKDNNGTAAGGGGGATVDWVMNLDCAGDYAHCKAGDANTKVCLDGNNGFAPHWPPPRVDNQGWLFDKSVGTITAVASGKCLESCTSRCFGVLGLLLGCLWCVIGGA